MKIVKAAIIAAVAYWGYKKYTNANALYKKVTAKITGIHNISIGLKKISFLIDLRLENPTNQAIEINTGGIVALKEVKLFTASNQYIGSAYPTATQIALPPLSGQTITGIPAQIETANIPGILKHLQAPGSVKTKLVIEAAGSQVLL